MKCSKDFWYNYSQTYVVKGNVNNSVQTETSERRTPKSPYIKVPIVHSVVRPTGIFLVDGVPVSRSAPKLAADHFERKKNRGGEEEEKKEFVFDLSPREIERKKKPKKTNNDMTLPFEHPVYSMMGDEKEVRPQSTKLPRLNYVSPEKLRPKSPSKQQLDHNKYYHRLDFPKPELIALMENAHHKKQADGLKHIYHDDNFIRKPVQPQGINFARFVLPSLCYERNLQSQWGKRVFVSKDKKEEIKEMFGTIVLKELAREQLVQQREEAKMRLLENDQS